MGEEHRDRFADELLEAALQRYRSEAPRPGLEARLLAHVQAREQAAWGPSWAWAMAATAAAMAIAALAIYRPHRRPLPLPSTPQPAASRSEPPVKMAAVPQPSSVSPLPDRRTRPVTVEQTRPGEFPTLAPLTEQEKLLLLYVKNNAASVLAAHADQQARENSEIPGLNIAALEIKPLEGSEGSHEQ
jgi:hypothetical protein